MGQFRLFCSVVVGAFALSGVLASGSVALAQEREQTDQQRNSQEEKAKGQEYKRELEERKLKYERGSMEDLYIGPPQAPAARSMARTSGVDDTSIRDDIAEKTKVWVAKEDIASTPGVETIIQHKSPVKCGRLGCELVIIAGEGEDRRVILRTIGHTVTPTAYNEVVINQGTRFETVWVFDGEKFVQQK